MWNQLVTEFAAAVEEVPQATLVRYEDLGDPAELERLTAFLELEAPLTAEIARVGSSRDRAFFRETVPGWESTIIRRTTSQGAGMVGYA